jgi:hypothetical protein
MNAAEAFIAYVQQHGEVSEAVRNFQSSYRGYFVGSAEEFTHSQKQVHMAFLELMDTHLSAFFAESGATEELFAESLVMLRESGDPRAAHLEAMLGKVEFEAFADLLKADICLCCGGQFRDPATVSIETAVAA